MHVDDLGSEWPPPQLVQVSEAPVLKWFFGQFSTPVRVPIIFVPAALVEQYAAPAEEYSPFPVQASQSASLEAPFALNVPAGHITSSAPSQYLPGGVAVQDGDPGSE